MQLKILSLKNFQSYEDETIDFNRLNCCLIEGRLDGNDRDSNGAGKSTIFDSIVWCVYGKIRVLSGASVDDIVRIGSEECSVELEFEHANVTYKIIRTRNKATGKSNLKFLTFNGEDWVRHSEAVKINDLNKDIVNVIGINYDMFVNSVYFKPGEISTFAEMTPGERIDAIKNILNINFYDKCMRLSRGRAKEVATKISTIKDRTESIQYIDLNIEDVERKIADNDSSIKELQKQLDIKDGKLSSIKANLNIDQSSSLYVKELSDRIKSMSSRLFSLKSDLERLDGRKAALTSRVETLRRSHLSAKKEYVSLQSIVENSDVSKLKSDLDSVKNSLLSAKNNLVQSESNKISLESRKKELEQKISKVDTLKTECPLCLRAIDESSRGTILSALDCQLHSILEELNNIVLVNMMNKKEEAELSGIVSSISTDIEAINSSLIKSRVLKDKLIDIKNSVADIDSDINGVISSREAVDLNIKNLEEEMSSKTEELESFSKVIENEKDLNSLSREVDSLREQLKRHDVLTGALKEKIKSLNKDRKKAVDDEAEVLELEELASDLKIIGDMFGKNGIQSMIVANTCVEVQAIVNDYLSQISDNRMSVVIEVDSGQFDINVNHNGVMKKLEQLSEGEKVRVAFAIRMAFSMLLYRRANGQGIEFLLIDEAIQNLDESGIEKFAEELVRLHNTYQMKIFLITHRTDIRNYFDERLVVDMVNGISTITIL